MENTDRNSLPEEGNPLYRYMPGGLCLCRNDAGRTILWASGEFYAMTGLTPEEIEEKYQKHYVEMICPEDKQAALAEAERQTRTRDSVELEYRILCKDGSLMWVLDKSRHYVTQEGEDALVCLLVDITERRRIEQELRLSLERYRVIMDQSTDIIFEWDIAADTLFLSSNWKKKFGYLAIESKISSGIKHSSRVYGEDKGELLRLMEDIRAGKGYSEAELRIYNIIGEYTWFRIRATAQYNDENQPIKAIGVILDIEEEKRRQMELLQEARQDALTGLLNKEETKRRIEKCLVEEYNQGSLILMDLDDFKHINDKYGHLCGDAVLSDTASVLRRLFRSSDIIGRIGGDEFMVFLPGADWEQAKEKADQIGGLLKEKRLPDSGDIIRSSIGIVEWPKDGGTFFELYRKADLALYFGKEHGKDKVTVYEEAVCCRHGEENLMASRSGSIIESEELTEVEERLVSYTFRMLYHSQNIESAVGQLLEIVGRAYDVSRVYIFESTADGKYCNNTFEWCSEGIEPQKDFLQNISYEEDLGGYIDNFNEEGVFYCQDTRGLDKRVYDILEPQGIKAMLQCAIIDDREFKGYVGFDECRQNRYWTKEQAKSLGLIANILSEFLLKYRLKERVKELTDRAGRASAEQQASTPSSR